jgi:hypothetical protein
VQHLEYSIAEGLNKINKAKAKNCNNQRKWNYKIFNGKIFYCKFKVTLLDLLHWIQLLKILMELLQALEKYDLAVIANQPKFHEMKTGSRSIYYQRGKLLWLIDQVSAGNG